MSRVAGGEWPPRSKNPSSIPTRGRPSTSARIRHRTSSRSLRGPRLEARAETLGAGRARRSTLPFGVNGIRSSTTNAVGIRWSGSTFRRCSRTDSTIAAEVSVVAGALVYERESGVGDGPGR